MAGVASLCCLVPRVAGAVVLFALLLVPPRAADAASTKAFPGAQGAGALALGGRGPPGSTPRVITVTSLDDGTAPGTLGWAIDQRGPRYVTFAVSGNIIANRGNTGGFGYNVKHPYITILGQTAPGKGITITCPRNPGTCLGVTADHVVIRYLRVRHLVCVNCPKGTGSVQNVTFWAGQDQILDHVSMSWSEDDSLDTARSSPMDRWTGQWLLLADGIVVHNTAMVYSFADQRTADASGATDVHHSIMIAHHRLPRGGTPITRLVNNIFIPLTGDSKAATDVCGGEAADIIGNFYKDAQAGGSRPYAISLESEQELNICIPDRSDARDPCRGGPRYLQGWSGYYPRRNGGMPSVYVSANAGHGLTGREGVQANWNALAFHTGGGIGATRFASPNSDFSACASPGPCPPSPAYASWRRTSPLTPALPVPIRASSADAVLESRLWKLAGASRRVTETGGWAPARDRFDEGVEQRARRGALFEPSSENDARYRGDGWSATLADIDAHANEGAPASTLVPGLPDVWVRHWRSVGEGHPTSAFDEAPWNDGYPAIELFASGLCPTTTTVRSCNAAIAAAR